MALDETKRKMTPSKRSAAAAEEGLSEYERLRLAKIARNEARLASLGLTKQHSILGILRSGQHPPNNRRGSQKRKQNEAALSASNEAPPPRRRSSPRLKENQAAKPKDSNAVVDSELENAKEWMRKHSFGDKKRKHPSSKHSPRKKLVGKRKQPQKKTATASAIDDLRDYEKDAFFALREWKRARGRELGYSNPCVICHNRTLVEMCRSVPDDEASLLGVWGISLPRLEQHGELLLEALAPWRKQLREGHARYNQTHDDGEYYKASERSRTVLGR